jgi:hypothetical protein
LIYSEWRPHRDAGTKLSKNRSVDHNDSQPHWSSPVSFSESGARLDHRHGIARRNGFVEGFVEELVMMFLSRWRSPCFAVCRPLPGNGHLRVQLRIWARALA